MGDGKTTGVAGWVYGRFEEYKRQRAALTSKWENNRRVFQCLDPETGKRWKPRAEATRDWHSVYVSDVGRTKTATAHGIVADAMFKGGGINFSLGIDDDNLAAPDVQPPEGNTDETEARASAIDRRTRRIRRQLEDVDAEGTLDAAILLAGEYGECCLKRYVKTVEKSALVRGLDGAAESSVQRETVPAFLVRHPQAIFRDLTTDDVHEGEGLIDRDELRLPALRAFLRTPLYDAAAVQELLDTVEGAGDQAGQATGKSDDRTPRQQAVEGDAGGTEVLEYWGVALVEDVLRTLEDRKALESEAKPMPAHYAGIATDLTGRDPKDWCEITATVAGGKVLRLVHTRTPSARPFFRLVWERDPDSAGGVGVPDKLLHHHVTLTGATRAMEDNTKLLSNLLLLLKRHYLTGDLDNWEPGKPIDVADDCDDARKAIVPVALPNILAPIMTVIETFLTMADLSSMVPRVQQGQQVAEPQTLGELNARLEQAGKYLAGVIRRADAAVEWMVNEHYRWIETDPDAEPMPWLFRVKALGFTSFENKVTRLARLMNALRMTIESPQIQEISRLRPLVEEIYKAMDIDPESILKSQRDLEAEAGMRREAMAGATGGDPVERQAAAASIARLEAEARDLAARAALNEQKAGQVAEERQIRKVQVVRALAPPPPSAGAP